ncbi:metallophosphoesterase family protein [Salipaludibacillus agaradhaerens]|uniref:metallophosphoesterase family protein n=1 Tax=Salipaludibacillus agaradhaerens TaxID=76935 RepID=UPI002150B9E2|nr:metallophosphoesterase family protein [Salipaludibacillus agaradhaerens]MCR6106633.1 metallophosphoesterase family protein [Salipaludibacillus agaradhaerens]MCR6118666.1 metallophosphoesterase family protein [Salipaludibacillus agaradhaerens]
MKLALISDIHGNAEALKSVLNDLSIVGATHVAVLGDLSFRGPQPKECLDLVRELQAKVIKGNADEWIVRGIKKGEVPEPAFEMMRQEQAWAKEQLTEEDLNYLSKLPETLELPLSNKEQLYACHATPSSLFDVISNEADNDSFSVYTEANNRATYYAYGHIHLPFLRAFSEKKIMNTGSVGLPFDGDVRASYIVLDSTHNDINIQFRRVSYDVEKACHALDETNYPETAKKVVKKIYTTGSKP